MGIKTLVQKAAQDIYDKTGKVTASALLEAARPEDSEIHSAFEWDDEKAGHLYRLVQARKYLREIQIIYENREERLINVRTVSNDEGYYKPVSDVVKNVSECEFAIDTLTKQIKASQKTVEMLQDALCKSEGVMSPKMKIAHKVSTHLMHASESVNELS